MPTSIECPLCKARMHVLEVWLGKTVTCSHCEGLFVARPLVTAARERVAWYKTSNGIAGIFIGLALLILGSIPLALIARKHADAAAEAIRVQAEKDARQARLEAEEDERQARVRAEEKAKEETEVRRGQELVRIKEESDQAAKVEQEQKRKLDRTKAIEDWEKRKRADSCLTADELIEAYRVNEAAANNKYENHSIKFIGLIGRTGRRGAINPYADMVLGSQSLRWSVRCFFADNAAIEALEGANKQETHFVIRGTCVGPGSNLEGDEQSVVLDKCEIIEQWSPP